jgi:hypothetical protein
MDLVSPYALQALLPNKVFAPNVIMLVLFVQEALRINVPLVLHHSYSKEHFVPQHAAKAVSLIQKHNHVITVILHARHAKIVPHVHHAPSIKSFKLANV